MTTEIKRNCVNTLNKEITNDPILFKKWFIKQYINNFKHKPIISVNEVTDVIINQNQDALRIMKDISRVVSMVCHGQDLSDEIFTKSRKGQYCHMRRITSYIMCKKLNFSISFVGRLMSKDHSTIIYYCKTVENWIVLDKKFQNDFNRIMSILRTSEIIYC